MLSIAHKNKPLTWGWKASIQWNRGRISFGHSSLAFPSCRRLSNIRINTLLWWCHLILISDSQISRPLALHHELHQIVCRSFGRWQCCLPFRSLMQRTDMSYSRVKYYERLISFKQKHPIVFCPFSFLLILVNAPTFATGWPENGGVCVLPPLTPHHHYLSLPPPVYVMSWCVHNVLTPTKNILPGARDDRRSEESILRSNP